MKVLLINFMKLRAMELCTLKMVQLILDSFYQESPMEMEEKKLIIIHFMETL